MFFFFKKAIVLLTETWTKELSDILVAGFKDFRLNRFNKKQNPKRDSRRHSTFLILIKHCKLFKKDGDDIIWLKLISICFIFRLICIFVCAMQSHRILAGKHLQK